MKDKLRNEKNLSETREKYLANLELRFSDLCDECKARTPGTAFSTHEHYALTKITKLLEEQQKEISDLKSKLGTGALRAPERGEHTAELTASDEGNGEKSL